MPWLPAHEAHAIERVGAIWQFVEQLPIKPWQELLDRATKDLTTAGFAPFQGLELTIPAPGGQAGNVPPVQIVFGPEGPIFGAQPGVSAGLHFQRQSAGAILEEIKVQRTFLGYSATRYDRWTNYKERMFGLLGAYTDQILSITNVSQLKLEYWDRFMYDGEGTPGFYAELLRGESKFVPSFIQDETQLWHSHIGYLIPQENIRRLINLNLDAIDVTNPSGMKRSVGIYSMGQDSFQGGTSPGSMTDLGSLLDDLHTILKDVLKQVITDDAAARISLNAGEDE